MSTFFRSTVICGCCGKETDVVMIGSTNCFGGCDLDTRPAPMQRWTIGRWIQACPHCGYVNPTLRKKISNIREFVNSSQYIGYDGINVRNELAGHFIRWALICSKQNDLNSEMWAYLHGAWACDDAGEKDTAVLLRKRSELCLVQLLQNDDTEDLRLLDADLLRRTEQFEEVLCRYENIFEKLKNPIIIDGMRFELEKAKEKDIRGYRFAENHGFELTEN